MRISPITARYPGTCFMILQGCIKEISHSYPVELLPIQRDYCQTLFLLPLSKKSLLNIFLNSLLTACNLCGNPQAAVWKLPILQCLNSQASFLTFRGAMHSRLVKHLSLQTAGLLQVHVGTVIPCRYSHSQNCFSDIIFSISTQVFATQYVQALLSQHALHCMTCLEVVFRIQPQTSLFIFKPCQETISVVKLNPPSMYKAYLLSATKT